MRWTAVSLLIAVAGGSSAVAGCSSQPQDDGPSSATEAGQARPAEDGPRWSSREPFTRTSEIQIDGAAVGYLVEYEPIPAAVDVERVLPTGSYRIQGLDFEDVGFITPRGELYRYAGTSSVGLGSWSRDEGLLQFYGGGRRVILRPLEPTPRKPRIAPPSEPAAEEGAEPAADAEEGAPEDE